MATARIVHHYDDTTETVFEVEFDQMFAGSMTEAVDEVLRMWTTAMSEED